MALGKPMQTLTATQLYRRAFGPTVGHTPAEAYGAGRPVDMMDKAGALPASPQAQQQQKNLINKILAA